MERNFKFMLACSLASLAGLIAVSAAGYSNRLLSPQAADTDTKSIVFGAGGNFKGNPATILSSGSLSAGSSVDYSYEQWPTGAATYGTSGTDNFVSLASVKSSASSDASTILWTLVVSLNNVTQVDVSYAITGNPSYETLYNYCCVKAFTSPSGSGTNVETDDEGNTPVTYFSTDQTSFTYVPSAAGIELNGKVKSVVLTVKLSVSNSKTSSYAAIFTLKSIKFTWSC